MQDGQTTTTPLWPFRLLALAAAGAQLLLRDESIGWRVAVLAAVVTLYTVLRIARPVRVVDEPQTVVRVVVEYAVIAAVVVLDGGWSSPFALCLVPTTMLAGLALGTWISAQMGAAVVVAVTLQHLTEADAGAGIRDGILWAALLGVVTYTSGLSHRATVQAASRERTTLERVSRLAEANSLLFALQRVTQTMPASLDLHEVLDASFDRLHRLAPDASISLHLLDETGERLDLARHVGHGDPGSFDLAATPEAIRSVIESPRTARIERIDGAGLDPDAATGLYSALRARGVTIGVLSIESAEPGRFSQQHAEMVHGLAETFGIAIDNARLFRQIRAIAADEERRRIARDLHDRIGSSLAFLGYEVDRVRGLAERDELGVDQIDELRAHVTSMIRDIRETLFDLRTDVSDDQDLPTTVSDLLARVGARSGLLTAFDTDVRLRPPVRIERELYRIAFEAIVNVERHAAAEHLSVRYAAGLDAVELVVTDDGVGLRGDVSSDRYGLIGMRERAERIGGRLVFSSPTDPGTGRGTSVQVHAPLDGRTAR